MSYVNFIVGWKLLRSCINALSLSSPWVQGAKMSSMYRIHASGWCDWVLRNSRSSWCMNSVANAGAILVPMAVPHVC